VHVVLCVSVCVCARVRECVLVCVRLLTARDDFAGNWGLKTLVRSHQCVPKGWEEIVCGNNISIWTVFSASDYDGVGNAAAVLVFMLCVCARAGRARDSDGSAMQVPGSQQPSSVLPSSAASSTSSTSSRVCVARPIA